MSPSFRAACFAVSVSCVSASSTASSMSDATLAILEGRQPHASFQVSGHLERYVRSAIGSASPVFAEIRSVRRYAKPGCHRLHVRITAPDAVSVDPNTGKPVTFVFEMEQDLCADGTPPPAR